MSLATTIDTTPVSPPVNPNKALWEKGDFTQLARCMRDSGDAFVASLGVKHGLRVLDLGCGDGTTAVPAAQRGANVLGIDIAENLVAAGNARAKALGLANLHIQQGDACNLVGVQDGAFDLVVSMFGAMFAPKPFNAANEMVRVTKPGGRIVMGNWIAGDPTFIAQVLRISAGYTPPPPEGFISPVTWGVEAHVIERFGAAGIAPEQIRCDRDTYTFNFDGTPAEFINVFERYYGPTMNAFAAAAKNGKTDALRGELVRLAETQNLGRGRKTSIPATFLRVTVTR